MINWYRESIYSRDYMNPQRCNHNIYGHKTIGLSNDFKYISYNDEKFPLKYHTDVRYKTTYFTGKNFKRVHAIDRIYLADDRELRITLLFLTDKYSITKIDFDNVEYRRESQ